MPLLRGDKIFYVIRGEDSEVEGYILEEVSPMNYKIKIRARNSVVFKEEKDLFQIFPEGWESLEENLKNWEK